MPFIKKLVTPIPLDLMALVWMTTCIVPLEFCLHRIVATLMVTLNLLSYFFQPEVGTDLIFLLAGLVVYMGHSAGIL